MVDLLTFEPVPTRRLPVLTYEALVRGAVENAARPTVNYVDHLPAGRVLDVVRSRPWPLDEQEADLG